MMHINIVVHSHYNKKTTPGNILPGLTGGLKTSIGFFLVHNIFINVNGNGKAVEGLGTI